MGKYTETQMEYKRKETLKQICKMVASGEIPNKIYDKYLSGEPIGFMSEDDLLEYFGIDD